MKKGISLFTVLVIVVCLLSSCAANKAVNEFDHTFKLKDSIKSHLSDDKVKAVEDYINAYMKLFSSAVAKNDLFAMAEKNDEAMAVIEMEKNIDIDIESALKEGIHSFVWDMMSISGILSAIGTVKSAKDVSVAMGKEVSEGEMYLSLASMLNSKEYVDMDKNAVKKAYFDSLKSRMSQILNESFDVVK